MRLCDVRVFCHAFSEANVHSTARRTERFMPKNRFHSSFRWLTHTF